MGVPSGGGRRTPEASRSLIVDGARQALREIGMGALTVGEVMDRTPLGRSSFYIHFADIDAVLTELLEQNVELFAAPASVWFEDPGPDTLDLGIRRILEVWEHNRGWWGELITAALAPRKELGRSWRATEVDTWAPAIAKLLPEDAPAVRAGGSREGAARNYVLLLFGALAEKSVEPDVDLDALAGELVAAGLTMFYGVANDVSP